MKAEATAEHLPRLLGRLGTASLAAMQPTNYVQEALEHIAAAYGRKDLRVAVLPTMVFVEDPAVQPPHTEFFSVIDSNLRLDQAGDIEKLVDRGADGELAPQELLSRLDAVLTSTPRFGPIVSTLGHTLLVLGFGMMLNPSLSALPVYAILGVVVGILLQFANRIRTLNLILPVFAAFVMTVFIVKVVQPHVDESMLRFLAPALMSFLPGLALTVATVELTNGQVISGASRMLYGIARLVLLGFGVFAAMTMLHHPPLGNSATDTLGMWAPWVGTVIVAIGYYFFSGAPRGSLPWIMFILIVAYAAQGIGNLVMGPQMSGIVGAAVVAPVSYALSRMRRAPASAVLLTCGYWLLVPGTLGFIGIGEVASSSNGADAALLGTLTSLLSIAIGMVIGVGLNRDAGSMKRRIKRLAS